MSGFGVNFNGVRAVAKNARLTENRVDFHACELAIFPVLIDFETTLPSAVEELIRHCLDPAAGGYTPSDFPEAGFTQEELEDFLSEVQQPD